mgnify:CR=1 FL=1
MRFAPPHATPSQQDTFWLISQVLMELALRRQRSEVRGSNPLECAILLVIMNGFTETDDLCLWSIVIILFFVQLRYR